MGKTFKVWLDIEEYDDVTGIGEKTADAPGAALAEFPTHEDAYDFAKWITSLVKPRVIDAMPSRLREHLEHVLLSYAVDGDKHCHRKRLAERVNEFETPAF